LRVALRSLELQHTLPVEAHLLRQGGHAFGTGYPGSPSEHWPALYSSWLAPGGLT